MDKRLQITCTHCSYRVNLNCNSRKNIPASNYCAVHEQFMSYQKVNEYKTCKHYYNNHGQHMTIWRIPEAPLFVQTTNKELLILLKFKPHINYLFSSQSAKHDP